MSGDVDWILQACQDLEIQRWTQVPRPYSREHALSFVTGPTDEFARWVVQVGAPSESGTEVGFVRAFIARDNSASRRAVERAGFEMVEAQLGPAVEYLVPVPTCVYMKRL